MPENKHLHFFLSLLYIALGIFLIWIAFKYLLGWLAPFIIAFIFSRLIERPVCFFEKRLRFPRPLASLLFTLVFYGIICSGVYLLSSKLIRETVILFDKLRTLNINQLVETLTDMFYSIISHLPIAAQDFINSNIATWLSEIVSTLRNLIGPIASYATNIATSVPSILIFIIASIVATYFLSCDYHNLKSKIASVTPMKWRLRFKQTRKQISSTLVNYLRALLILLCLTFVELSIGLAILGIENFFLIAMLIALIDALPILGTGGILIPWAIISLFAGNYLRAIGLVVIYGVIVVVRNMIEPRIVGKQIGLHPFVTLLAMYVGLRMFGVIGMFMPIPIALVKQFYVWGYFDFLKKQETES